jgi:uncharacterized protein YjbJ (UPF0337 family)
MWNKDEVKGKGKKAGGTIKEKVGKVTRNPELEEEGRSDRQEGELQEGFGKVRRKAGEVIEKAGKTISRG